MASMAQTYSPFLLETTCTSFVLFSEELFWFRWIQKRGVSLPLLLSCSGGSENLLSATSEHCASQRPRMLSCPEMIRIQHLSQALEARFLLISNSWPACNIMENRHILSCKNYSSGHHLTVWHSGDSLLLEKFCKCICVFESLKVTGLSGEYVASAPSVHQASLCLPINIANPPPPPPPPNQIISMLAEVWSWF